MSAVDGLTPSDLAAAWRATAASMRGASPMLQGVSPDRTAGYAAALELCAEQIETAERLALATSMARHPAGRHRTVDDELSLRQLVGRHRRGGE